MADKIYRGTVSSVSGSILVLGPPTLATLNPPTNSQIIGIAGEALQAGMACHISLVDGKIYKSYGGGATAYLNSGVPLGSDPAGYTDASLAQCDGFVLNQVFAAGEAVTLVFDVVMDYLAVALAPGSKLYIGTTVGVLQDAASTNGTIWVGKVMPEAPATTTGTKVFVRQSTYL